MALKIIKSIRPSHRNLFDLKIENSVKSKDLTPIL